MRIQIWRCLQDLSVFCPFHEFRPKISQQLKLTSSCECISIIRGYKSPTFWNAAPCEPCGLHCIYMCWWSAICYSVRVYNDQVRKRLGKDRTQSPCLISLIREIQLLLTVLVGLDDNIEPKPHDGRKPGGPHHKFLLELSAHSCPTNFFCHYYFCLWIPCSKIAHCWHRHAIATLNPKPF